MPTIYAHRGFCQQGEIENTLPAFHAGVDAGAHGIELDVRASSDGVVFAFHDGDYGRLLQRSGQIEHSTSSYVKSLRVGKSEIPTLHDVIDAMGARGAVMNVEIKNNESARGTSRYASAEAVAQALRSRSALDRSAVIVSSFSPRTLMLLRGRRVHVPLGFLFDPQFASEWTLDWVLRVLRPDAVHPVETMATPAHIRDWLSRGLLVNPWCVNSASRAKELTNLGVTSLITDRPDLVVPEHVFPNPYGRAHD